MSRNTLQPCRFVEFDFQIDPDLHLGMGGRRQDGPFGRDRKVVSIWNAVKDIELFNNDFMVVFLGCNGFYGLCLE